MENIQSNDEKNLLVHRHKTSERKGILDKASHIEKISETPKKSVESEVAVSESGHNLLYLVFIIFIVFILLFLILRRILSM